MFTFFPQRGRQPGVTEGFGRIFLRNQPPHQLLDGAGMHGSGSRPVRKRRLQTELLH